MDGQVLLTLAGSASGDGGHDGNGIALVDRRVFPREEANILLVDVDVDETAQFALLVGQTRGDAGILTLQVGDYRRNRSGRDGDGLLLAGKLAQRRRDQYVDGHNDLFLSKSISDGRQQLLGL